MVGMKHVSVEISLKLRPLRSKKWLKATNQVLKILSGKYPAYQLQLIRVSVSGS